MAKTLLTLSVLFLTLSGVFGFLNMSKARNLREVAQRSSVAQAEVEQVWNAREKELETIETSFAADQVKFVEAEKKVSSAETELIKTHSEKADLQAKLRTNQNEIAELQKRIDELAPREFTPETLPMPGAGDLQSQLEETRKQLDMAEREKESLSEKVRIAQGRPAPGEGPKRKIASARPGVRGTVLAVNQAYNFVVLNLGGRQGVEAGTEMLVLRGGTLIGKIRVSSVEPATAIGDIMTNSLARRVQVQPGDVVIYAGTNS